MSGFSFESTLKKSRETDMKKLLLTAIVGALACGSAMADRWAWTTVNDDNTFIQAINLDSIECEGKIYSGWVASVNTSLASGYDLMQDLMEIDCKRMKMKSLYSAAYRRNSLLEEYKEDSSFSVIPLGTVIYTTAKYLCKGKKQKTSFTGDPFDAVEQGRKVLLEEAKRSNKK